MVTATAATHEITSDTTHSQPTHQSKNTQQPNEMLDACIKVVTTSLEDTRAKEIVTMDVTHATDITDRVVIASGTSNRHVRALASAVASDAKKAGFTPIGKEGEEDAEWVLVDLGDVVVHIMLAKTRAFYDLEGLWLNPDDDIQNAS